MASPRAETKCEAVEAAADGVEPKDTRPDESAGRRRNLRRRRPRSSYLPKLACLRSEPDGAADGVQPKDTRPDESAGSRRNLRRRKRRSSYLPKLSCLRSEPDGAGGFEVEVAEVGGERPHPAHLVILANGLIGSARDWRFAEKQFLKKYQRAIVVHCSKCNPCSMTFDGVDEMGKRLAEEVMRVVKSHPDLKRISFIGHSLGGLVARYAIARLYGQDLTEKLGQENNECRSDESENHRTKDKFKKRIAGLEPVNFITVATPHLGSGGHKQVPAFCGLQTLERLAAHASWFLGRTIKHLFLTDCDDGKPPLLRQMTEDTDDLKFISALRSFKRRVAYANARFDQLVGWSTSSLRLRSELPKRDRLAGQKNYPHIVNVEAAKASSPERVVSSENRDGAGIATDVESLSEEMLRRLSGLGWERVDVSFSGSIQQIFAHSTIQVKTHCIHSEGADVVQHMIDHFHL